MVPLIRRVSAALQGIRVWETWKFYSNDSSRLSIEKYFIFTVMVKLFSKLILKRQHFDPPVSVLDFVWSFRVMLHGQVFFILHSLKCV